MFRWLLLLLFLLFTFSLAFPQKKAGDPLFPGERLTAWFEEMAGYGETELLVSDFTSEINDLLASPVRINSGSEDEISRLFFLTWFQQQSLIEYTRQRGGIVSVNEIAYLPGFDRELAGLLEPFIIFSAGREKSSHFSRTRLAAGYIFSESYREENSIGPPWKMYLRGERESRRFRAGFTTEKDQGEPLLHDGYRPDYLSGYISYSSGGYIRNITVGDFRVKFGQGLTAWTGYQAGVSALAPLQIKGKASISPYRSTDENNFFRGVGITAGKGNHTLLAYLSANRIDATLNVNEITGVEEIKSFYKTGLHNSETTLQKKDQLSASSAGISYTLNSTRLRTGISATANHFSLPVSTPEHSYDIYDFSGNTNFALSVDHSLSLKKALIYGEAAWNPGGGFALTQGAKFIPAPGTSLNIMYTNIMKGYNSFHGVAAGRETVNHFRETASFSFFFEPVPYVTIATGLLRRKDNWYGQWGTPPLATTRYESQITYSPSDRITLTSSLKIRELTGSVSEKRGVRRLSESHYTNIRINLSYQPLQPLTLQTRAEFIKETGSNDYGYLLLQGLRISHPSLPVTLITRISVWSTPGYKTRIYAWEDDLLYSNTITPFYNRGYRSYILISAGESNKTVLRVRAGFTHMDLPSGVPGGSSGGEVRDNVDLRMELRITL